MLFFSPPPPPPTTINLMAHLLGTFEIKMAANNSKYLICTILRNNRGLWTVYLPPIFLIKRMMACNASGFCNSFFYRTGSLDLCPVLNLEDQRVTVCLFSKLQPVWHRWPYWKVKTPANVALGVIKACKGPQGLIHLLVQQEMMWWWWLVRSPRHPSDDNHS